jgi:hypothetical protein
MRRVGLARRESGLCTLRLERISVPRSEEEGVVVRPPERFCGGVCKDDGELMYCGGVRVAACEPPVATSWGDAG